MSPAFDSLPTHANATRQDILQVQGIDFCVAENGASHHTNKFHLMNRNVDRCLVVRRGLSFKLDLLLNRPYDAKKDGIYFIFNVADEASRGPSSITSAVVPLMEKRPETPASWNATYQDQKDNHLIVAVIPVADCIVAPWTIEVDTKTIGGSSLTYKHPLPIYILFNAWCLKDTVYMPDESHRHEYVLEDRGLLFQGSYNRMNAAAWSYAQYDKDILDCAMYLLRRVGNIKGAARGDPIPTSRGLSAAVNEHNDNGVISGRWDDDYSGGERPSYWVGSLEILQQYYKTRQPVKYGQCWVYAGVLTTVCRALGIPCRPVTGYEAAHEAEGSLTIDIIVDNEGNRLNELIRDSVWNFHVWNEAWMSRPDLGPDYGGWQIIDSTPQEPSENMMRCGPASLKAVKNGEVNKSYDATYVFAEVNADMAYWKYSPETGTYKLISIDSDAIGKNLSTKAIGRMERQDVTDNYKYSDGSREERMTMEKALNRNITRSNNTFARYYLNEAFDDVMFDFELRDDIKIGQEFNVVLHIKNRSVSDSHQIKGILRVNAVSYRGITGDEVKIMEFNLNLEPSAKKDVKMLVTFDEYYKKLVDQGCFKISCLATVVETQFDFVKHDNFRVRDPDIVITINGEPVVYKELTVTLNVENPLPIPLTEGKFYIESPGLNKRLQIELNKKVAPGDFATAQFKLTPAWDGKQQIVAKFTSKEIHNADGVLSFMVNA